MTIDEPVTLVIASVLKPVNDVRMYKKFAKSLACTGKYAVNIVGFRSSATLPDSSIKFHEVFAFSRLSVRRLLANWVFYRTLRIISPHLILLTTPELYPAVWWYRKRRNVLLVYDMRENYRRNVRHNRGFPVAFILPIVRILSKIEHSLLTTAQLLLLAEKGYQRELQLPKDTPVRIIENKALFPSYQPHRRSPSGRGLQFVYTGTVSEVYGIKSALAVMKALIETKGLSATLTVLGHVPQAALYHRLEAYAQQHPWLQLRTSLRPVPHSDIIALIRKADVGIVSHQPVPSIAHCFPTRIWEYMAYRLPFLLQDHPYWTDYCKPWQCAVPLDFNRPKPDDVIHQLTTQSFYPSEVPDTIYWSTEEKKLTESLDDVISRRPTTIR